MKTQNALTRLFAVECGRPVKVRRIKPHTLAVGDSGFTLLEVLVALTILGFSISVVFAAFSQSVARIRSSENQAAALALAQSLLAGAETATSPKTLETQGETATHYQWKIRIEPFGTREDQASWSMRLEKIIVTVSGPGTSIQRDITLSSLRLLPPGRQL